MRPVLSPTRSTTGLVICRRPLEHLDLAEEHRLGARRQLALAERLVEERDLQVAACRR